jgi:hypothetical protein
LVAQGVIGEDDVAALIEARRATSKVIAVDAFPPGELQLRTGADRAA